jgi:hypothetical protein
MAQSARTDSSERRAQFLRLQQQRCEIYAQLHKVISGLRAEAVCPQSKQELALRLKSSNRRMEQQCADATRLFQDIRDIRAIQANTSDYALRNIIEEIQTMEKERLQLV